MNPQTVKSKADLMKVREAYLANLEAEQRNLKKTADAMSVLQQTGQPPIAPQDTRTISEKLMDVEKLKINLRKMLLTITDGQQTSDIMNALSNDEVQALSIILGNIIPVFQDKYKNGVPAPIFLEYIRRYIKDYNMNMGIASGIQGVLAEELKLTRDMMNRVIPNQSIIDELDRAIMLAPPSATRDQLIDAVRKLKSDVPNIDDIVATQNILSEVEQANLATLIDDALKEVPTASDVQKLTKDIINTLRGGDKKQTESMLSKTLRIVKLDKEQSDKLSAISEALRQEQQESFAPKEEKLKSAPSSSELQQIATLLGSKLKEVDVRTGVRTTRAGKQVFETKKETQLVLDPRYKINDAKIKLAAEIQDLDVLDAPEIMAGRFSKPALVQYFDYISKRDTGRPLDPQKSKEISALTNAQLKEMIASGKTSGEFWFDMNAPQKASPQKAASAQATMSQIGGVATSGIDWGQKAEEDFTNGKLMTPADFVSLPIEDLDAYLVGLFNTNAVRTQDLSDEYKAYMSSAHLDKTEGLTLLAKTKMVTGMGMKKAAKKVTKNIVFGCGMSKAVSKPKKQFVEKIDFADGLPLDKSYIPFGKYVIHKHKLTGGVLQIRTIKGGAIPKLPTLGISPALGKIIKKMVGGSLPTYDEMSSLSDEDKNTLYKVFKLSQVDKADMLPAPDKSKEEQEMNRFQILKGQIQAGNNSAELIREFKCMLMKFISGGKIPRGQGMDIICELMALGY